MSESSPKNKTILLRLLLLLLISLALSAVFFFDLHTYISFDNLKSNHDYLQNFVTENALIAGLIFIGIYIVVVSLSLPGATILSVTGGFLFGHIFGTLYIVFAATCGACVIFLVARFVIGENLAKKGGPWIAKLQDGFKENAFHYLLTLRLIPLFPFFVVNFVPALLGVRFFTFSIATFIGIIPGSFVFALAGSGLGSVFESGNDFSINSIMTPEITFAFIGLGIMSSVPAIYKHFKKTK